MAEQIPFKVKALMGLYDFGIRNFGPSILSELSPRGNTWRDFAMKLFEDDKDAASREIVVKKLVSKGFVERHKSKKAFQDLMIRLISDGMSMEKKKIAEFIRDNLEQFDTEDENLRLQILGMQRSRDPSISAIADELLPRIGIDMDDPALYKSAR